MPKDSSLSFNSKSFYLLKINGGHVIEKATSMVGPLFFTIISCIEVLVSFSRL